MVSDVASRKLNTIIILNTCTRSLWSKFSCGFSSSSLFIIYKIIKIDVQCMTECHINWVHHVWYVHEYLYRILS